MSDRPPYYNPLGRPVTPPKYNPYLYPGSPAQVGSLGWMQPPYHGQNQWRPPSYRTIYPDIPGQPIAPPYPDRSSTDWDRPAYGCSIASPANYGKRFWTPPPHCSGSYEFVPGSNGYVPGNAVHGGQDKDGGPIYIGRAYHEGDIVPAKICPNHGCAFISYRGEEIGKIQYEVLCSSHVAWKYGRDGSYPPEAIGVGQTSDGETLFVGRTMIEGTMTPGKVHSSHRVLYIPFNNKELSFSEYEILVLS